MANSYVEITSTGSTSVPFSFSYLNESEIKVYVDGVEDTSKTFTSANVIQLSATPASGVTIRVERNTDLTTRSVDFSSGSILTEADLDLSAQQVFNAVQEAVDDVGSTVAKATDGLMDAQNLRIKNVANPVNDQDAVTKHYLSNTFLTDANKTALTTVNSNISNINAVNSNETNINAAVSNATNINSAVSNATNINSVAGSIANVNAVGADLLEATSEIDTVATNITNVNNTAGAITNINTVAGQISPTNNISTVAGAVTNINTVATNIASVNTVASDITKVVAVANDLAESVSEIVTVADDLNEASSEIDTVAQNIANVNTVGGISGNVTTVAGISGNVTTVAGMSSAINTVNSNSSNINTVAGNDANITTVAGNNSNITTVAGVSSNVTTVAGIASDVTTVAGANANVTAVAGAVTNVNNVGGSIANVNTVASNLSGVNAFANQYSVGSSDPTTNLDEGDLFFNTTSDTMKVYNGSSWQNAGSSVNGTSARGSFTATAAQTTFSATYDVGYIDIYLNGAKQLVGTDVTATSGSNFVFASGLAAGDIVEYVAYGTFNVSTALATSGGTMTGTITFASGQTFDGVDVSGILDNSALTGTPTAPTATSGTNTTQVATTEYVTTAVGNVDLSSKASLSGATFTGALSAKGGAVFNEDSADVDFRVESNGNANMLFVDGGQDVVGIGNAGGYGKLTVAGSVAVVANDANKKVSFWSTGNGDSENAKIAVDNDGSTTNTGEMKFSTRNASNSLAERMRISASGNVAIGNTDPEAFGSLIDNLVVGTTSGNNGMTIVSGTDSGGRFCFSDNTASPQRGMIEYDHPSDSFLISTAGTQALKIDSSGAITKALQPAFQVSYSAGGVSNLTTNQFNNLAFSAETFDIGSNHDGTTFTAPVTGKYMFAISLTFLNLDKDHTNWEMVLVTSNRNYQTSNTFDDWLEVDAGAITGHLTVLADMDASDTAFIKIAPTGGASQTDIHSTSYWSGYLAC